VESLWHTILKIDKNNDKNNDNNIILLIYQLTK